MPMNAVEEHKLAGLHPARRNRYYYGKLMDVLHFSMEQQYVLAKEWLFNRAVLGPGVVCGLAVKRVSTAAGDGIVIGAGLAIDGWGREIVVPEDIALVPLTLTDQCGGRLPDEQRKLAEEMTVKLCYAECDTDFAPAMVNDPDCGCGDACEPGTVIETYCVKVLEGSAPAVDEPCAERVMAGLKKGELHTVLCELSRSCPPDPDDPCLTLANVKLADGELAVDSCTPRLVAPTNRILMQLVSCLADCCAGGGDGTPQTPPVKQLLQVTAVRALTTGGQQKPDEPNLTQVAELVPPDDKMVVTAERRANVIEIAFDPAVAYDPSSTVLDDSVYVLKKQSGDHLITGIAGNALRIFRPDGFQPGEYEVVLIGDGDAGGGKPHPVRATDGTRLDGEFPAAGGAGWHSGDGSEGGDFKFGLVVTK